MLSMLRRFSNFSEGSVASSTGGNGKCLKMIFLGRKVT